MFVPETPTDWKAIAMSNCTFERADFAHADTPRRSNAPVSDCFTACGLRPDRDVQP